MKLTKQYLLINVTGWRKAPHKLPSSPYNEQIKQYSLINDWKNWVILHCNEEVVVDDCRALIGKNFQYVLNFVIIDFH
jgi:hypothetical protein